MPAYLNFSEIKKGESKAKGHEGTKGWIEVDDLNFASGLESGPFATGKGWADGKFAFRPYCRAVSFSKNMDSTSVLLLQEALTGKGQKAKIDFVRLHKNELVTYLEVTLTDAIINQYHVVSEGERPKEKLSISFTKIEYRYTPYDDNNKPGNPVPFAYDLMKASQV